MKYTKSWTEFLNEDRKYNEYLQSLPVWKDFIAKFNQLRKRNRGKANADILKKSTGSIFHEQLPNGEFIDEWSLEQIHRNWIAGVAKPVPYGQEHDKYQTMEFNGLKDPEIGDILIHFRGYAWLYKPDENFNYKYVTSAAWGHDKNPNMWDDISYFDGFARNYVFKFQKDEIPLIFRKKLSRQIRSTVYDTGTGYKSRKKTPTPYTADTRNPNSGPAGYTYK